MRWERHNIREYPDSFITYTQHAKNDVPAESCSPYFLPGWNNTLIIQVSQWRTVVVVNKKSGEVHNEKKTQLLVWYSFGNDREGYNLSNEKKCRNKDKHWNLKMMHRIAVVDHSGPGMLKS